MIPESMYKEQERIQKLLLKGVFDDDEDEDIYKPNYDDYEDEDDEVF